MIDTNTIDSTESIGQLRITARKSYNRFAKDSVKALKKKNHDREDLLRKVFTSIKFGESAYQKSKAQFVRMVSNICQGIAQKIQKNPKEKQAELQKISSLKKLLLVLDQEQAIERTKADMMTRWIRGTFNEVTKIERNITGDIERYNQSRQRVMSRMPQKNRAADNSRDLRKVA